MAFAERFSFWGASQPRLFARFFRCISYIIRPAAYFKGLLHVAGQL